MAGRKPGTDSRADEFRRVLLEWRQQPEETRPSLRDLARTLGTSHQMLSHLRGNLDSWLSAQHFAAASAIREKARVENRYLTDREAMEARGHDQTGTRLLVGNKFEELLRKIRAKANRQEPLNYVDAYTVKMCARQQFTLAIQLQADITAGRIQTMSKSETAKHQREQQRKWGEEVFRKHHPEWSEAKVAATVRRHLRANP
jgi:hypothetical protein